MSTTITKMRTRTQAKRASNGLAKPQTRAQRRKNGLILRIKNVINTSKIRTLPRARTPLPLPPPFKHPLKPERLERNRTSSPNTNPSTRAARASVARLGSEPDSSGPDGSGSCSKHTSTETSDHSRGSKDSGRKSSGSAYEAQLIERVTDSEGRTSFLVHKEEIFKDKQKRRPCKLSLEKVQNELRGVRAVRESPTSVQARNSLEQEALPGLSQILTREYIPLPQDEYDFASIPLTEAQLPPPRRRSEDRPSPRSLREARLKQLSQTIRELDAELSAPPLLRDHHCPPLIRSHYEAPRTPFNSQEQQACAPSGPSRPASPSPTSLPKRRVTVHIQVASLSAERIITLANRGYVIDILPSVAVHNLPLDTNTRLLVKRYLSRNRGTTITGFGRNQTRHDTTPGSTFEQWCYVSRLNMADIGLDGRRRSNNAARSDGKKDEKHNVVLVPLTAVMAEELRNLLYRESKQERVMLRRRNLGTEIA